MKTKEGSMSRTVVVRGHVVGPKTVELDTPAPSSAQGAEVTVHLETPPSVPRLSELLRRLPPGTRSAADIEQQIEEERASWGE
jgi:hypothetical protein